jgi:hypothetical protein
MASNPAERRRAVRLNLQIPIFVRGKDVYGETFLDLSRTLDICSDGACLVMVRSVRMNEILSLTIPAPPPTPSGVVPAETPPMQARVLRRQAAGDVHRVGVQFLKPIG